MERATGFEAAAEGVHDVLVIGGGISGASVFRELARRGRRVLLVDRGDFASGTSQASGMLIWGGLLYLKQLDFRTVAKLSASRDRMLATGTEPVELERFRYLPLIDGGPSRTAVHAALYLYWLLGGCRRRRPYAERDFATSALIRRERFDASLVYEEAALLHSDGRLVLDRLFEFADEDAVPLNHCELAGATWDSGERVWQVDLVDRRTGRELVVRSRVLVNAAGVWADRVNERLGVESDHRHAMSKGVYLVVDRPAELDEALVFEMGDHGDSQTFTPWGPVALWGPTETALEHLEDGLAPTVEDVRFLLDQANRNLSESLGPEDIVSVRCGIRPLAVKRDYRAAKYPLELSRRHVVSQASGRPALTLYGGKLTSSSDVAREVADRADALLGEVATRTRHARVVEPPRAFRFPGIEAPQLDPEWCASHELCATLSDYLRRRTNLSQWVRRRGLGQADEHADVLADIARRVHGSDEAAAREDVEVVRSRATRLDALLESV